ncbi:tetratricopeptide repeat protein [mine drainage metagenome]|uniref:Tetratricopeptide repeat protein n=1 Tax=mine drainage metagenome TaxID=410659 RepID=A0A1J5SUW8_9ZZZZ
MKRILFFSFLFFSFYTSIAQEQDAKKLYASAKDFMRQGDYDNASITLENALKAEPGNLDMLKDMAFLSYLKRDFAKSIEISKTLIERPDADEQTFQMLGITYKAIAEYKECNKLYKTGLKKFPNSGVLHNDFGELLAQSKDMNSAIEQWENGIQLSPSYSSNYFNAANYYARTNNLARVIIYGELFINLESYTSRTADIKALLLEAYKKLFADDTFIKLSNDKNNSAFTKLFFATLEKSRSIAAEGITAENLTAIRTSFILNWFHEKNNTKFPFRLFDHQQYLLSEGLFDAYNEWIFGAAASPSAYQVWIQSHDQQAADFKKFQQSRVFKIPSGQYYY